MPEATEIGEPSATQLKLGPFQRAMHWCGKNQLATGLLVVVIVQQLLMACLFISVIPGTRYGSLREWKLKQENSDLRKEIRQLKQEAQRDK